MRRYERRGCLRWTLRSRLDGCYSTAPILSHERGLRVRGARRENPEKTQGKSDSQTQGARSRRIVGYERLLYGSFQLPSVFYTV